MILDNEDQRELILNALRNVSIQGDYEGISKAMPRFAVVIEAVQSAEIASEGTTKGEFEKITPLYPGEGI